MKKVMQVLFCFCCCAALCDAQDNKIDSLLQVLKTSQEDTAKVKTLNELSYEMANNNPDTAIYIGNEALTLATKLNYKMGIANAYYSIGNVLRNQGNYEEALKNCNNALTIYEQLLPTDTGPEKSNGKSKILEKKARIYNIIGAIFAMQGNYAEALKYTIAALKIAEEISDKKVISTSYNNIGMIYYNQSNYPEALKNFSASLHIREEIGDKYGLGLSYNNIGMIYEVQDNYPEALKNYSISLNIREEIRDKYGIAASYNNIGTIYDEIGNYPEALKKFFAALEIAEDIGDKDGSALFNCNIGKVYLTQKKNKEASQYLNKGLELAKEIGNLEDIKASYYVLTALDSAEGNFKKSLEHYKLYIAVTDSLVNQENTKKMTQIQMQYEFDKKEELAKHEREEKDAIALKELQKQKIIKDFSLGAIGLVLVLFFFIYRSYRARQALRLNDIRNRIAGDLHDDIGSTLNSISIYSEVAKKKDNDHDEALEMIGDASRKIIEAMSDIVWTINAENDSFEKIIFRMKSLAYNLFRAKKIEFTFHADETLNEKKLSLEERRNFYLIFKEAINNMVKYSNATRANITLTNENNRIRLRIRDNGIGFDTSQENAGNGLKNMKRRADEMKADFKIESQTGSGTQIELNLRA